MFGLGLTGSTHYFLAFDASGNAWNGSGYEAWLDGHYATYPIAAAEQGTSGRFTGTTPANAAEYQMRRRIGGSAALTDPVAWEDEIQSGGGGGGTTVNEDISITEETTVLE